MPGFVSFKIYRGPYLVVNRNNKFFREVYQRLNSITAELEAEACTVEKQRYFNILRLDFRLSCGRIWRQKGGEVSLIHFEYTWERNVETA